jgi:hypothetical protein
MATELSANNPDLIESIRRNMGNRTQPDGNNDSIADGNADESTGILNKIIKKTKIYLYFSFFSLDPNNSSDQNNPPSS